MLGDYNLDFSIKNLFNQHYENSFLYSGTPRTINIGLKKHTNTHYNLNKYCPCNET